MALAATDGSCRTWSGSVEGDIAEDRLGNGGFGYDPIFIPRESGISFAEMGPDAKNKISHRARAIKAFLAGIDKF